MSTTKIVSKSSNAIETRDEDLMRAILDRNADEPNVGTHKSVTFAKCDSFIIVCDNCGNNICSCSDEEYKERDIKCLFNTFNLSKSSSSEDNTAKYAQTLINLETQVPSRLESQTDNNKGEQSEFFNKIKLEKQEIDDMEKKAILLVAEINDMYKSYKVLQYNSSQGYNHSLDNIANIKGLMESSDKIDEEVQKFLTTHIILDEKAQEKMEKLKTDMFQKRDELFDLIRQRKVSLRRMHQFSFTNLSNNAAPVVNQQLPTVRQTLQLTTKKHNPFNFTMSTDPNAYTNSVDYDKYIDDMQMESIYEGVKRGPHNRLVIEDIDD